MTKAETLRTLAERVEKLTVPDRRLDYEIFAATAINDRAHQWYPTEGNFFTASLDAALSLVPEGFDWVLEHVNGGLTIGARVGHNDLDRTVFGGTPALALTAAALRARAAMDEIHD